MRKKRFLFLLLSALACGGSMYAQKPTSVDIAAYSDLKTAFNKIEGKATLADLQEDVDKAEKDFNDYPDGLKYVYMPEKTSDVHNDIVSFADAVNSANTVTVTDETKISYAIGKVTETFDDIDLTTYTLYITIPSVMENNGSFFSSFNNSYGIIEGKWNSIKANEVHSIKKGNDTDEKNKLKFYDNDKQIYPDEIRILFRKKNVGEVLCSDGVELVKNPQTAQGAVYGSMFAQKLLEKIKSASASLYSADQNYTSTEQVQQTDANGEPLLSAAGQSYKDAWDNAKEEYNKKKKELGDLNEYETITTLNITKDITVTDNELVGKTWPAGYTLDGGYNRIDVGSNGTLFKTNEGIICNAVSQNGRLAMSIQGEDAMVSNCIVKTASSTYRIYEEDGGSTISNDIVEAIYTKMRGHFGYDFSTGNAGKLTNDTKIYQAKYADAENPDFYEFKVNITGNNLVYDTNSETHQAHLPMKKDKDGELVLDKDENPVPVVYDRDNTFVYIENTDATTSLKNVAVKTTRGTYTCQNAVLTDGQNSQGFYVPTAFTATNLSYGRVFNKTYAAVCLPFALTAKQIKDMDAYAYTFQQTATNSKGENVIRLERIDGNIAANTPFILVFKENEPATSAVFAGLTGVSVASTAGATLSNDNNRLFGNYEKYQSYKELQAQAEEEGVLNPVIYGIQTKKDGNTEFVKMHEESHMLPFRSFVALPGSTSDNARFSISLFDENGNEEVTGIELVNMSNNDTASDFKAVGGRNAIEITTGKACDVKVYTLNGALAKTARVEAGITTLPMNAGMYVVNKTKVIVK